MSFGLSRGRELDVGSVGVSAESIPALPDDVLTNRAGGYLNLGSWFEHPRRPLEIEIGSGKGTFLLQQAPRQPETNFLGIEYAREFYLYAADRIRRAGTPNIRMLCTDASEFVHWRVPSGSVSVMHLYFADPWPKSRHHRRRMVQDRFLADCHRVLVPRGELRIVTDHADYWAWMEEHFARWTQSTGQAAAPPFVRESFTPILPAREADADESGAGEPPTEPKAEPAAELVGTNFERKYRVEGRSFYSAVLRKAE